MQDPIFNLPPGGLFDERGYPAFDPNGPIGRMVVPGNDGGGMTLGQMAQQREFQPFNQGFYLDYQAGVATPYTVMPGIMPFAPSPYFLEMQAAAMFAQASRVQDNQGYSQAELLLLLLS